VFEFLTSFEVLTRKNVAEREIKDPSAYVYSDYAPSYPMLKNLSARFKGENFGRG